MSDERQPPKSSSLSPASSSELASSESLDSRSLAAFTRALRGAEYELRAQREQAAAAEKNSKFNHEITHGHAKVLRVEIDAQRTELSAARRALSEMNTLIRERAEIERAALKQAKILAPSGVPRLSRWAAAGWTIPTPYQVYAGLFVIAEGFRESEFFAPHTLGSRLVTCALAMFALLGINSAKNYISLQVRSKLRAFDERAMEDLHSLPPHKETP